MGCTASSSKVVALDPSVAPGVKTVSASSKANSQGETVKVVQKAEVAKETTLLKKDETQTTNVSGGVPKLDLRSPRENAAAAAAAAQPAFEPLPDIPMKTGRTNKVVAFEITDEDRIKLRAPPRRLQQLQPLPKITQEQLNEKQRIADEKRTRALESKRMKSARTSRRRKSLRAALQAACDDADPAEPNKPADCSNEAADKDRLNVSLVRTDLADMQLRTAVEDENDNDRGLSLAYEDEQVYKRQRQHEKQTSPRDSLREQLKADRKGSADSRRSTESGIGSAAHSAGSSRKVPMEVSKPFYSQLDANIKLNLND